MRYLAAAEGIRQFLDIGTGLPTADNTHEVSQAVAPESRVVYVDNDPLVLAHARALLTSSPEGGHGLPGRRPARHRTCILEQAAGSWTSAARSAIMLLAILHYIPDLAEARRIVARADRRRARGQLPCHLARGHRPAARPTSPRSRRASTRTCRPSDHHVARPHDVVQGFFDGFPLVEPGLVRVSDWRPDSPLEAAVPTILWGGVAAKP